MQSPHRGIGGYREDLGASEAGVSPLPFLLPTSGSLT
jgi:hypothetical protein